MLDPCLAIIPARGGSKGLPGKNIRPLAGLPLLVHSVRCAARVPRVTRTIVSTDSEEIAAVARAHGADVPFMRPCELAQDRSPTMPVLTHALREVEEAEGRKYGSVLLLEATSPARLPEDIEAAFRVLESDPTADGAIGCSRPIFNPFYVGVVEEKGALAPAFKDSFRLSGRQEAPVFYRVNGMVYLWRRDFIAKGGEHSLDGRVLKVETPELRSWSIDELVEFDIVETLVKSKMIRLPWL